MKPLLLYFASGESLYPGVVLLLVTVLTSKYRGPRWLALLRSITLWTAVAMIVMACPPFLWLIDVILVATFLLWLFAWHRVARTRLPKTLQILTASVLVSLLIALSVVELFHREIPILRGDPNDRLVVIGDSISSGLDPRSRPWPAVMQQMTGVEVINLSRAGATMTDGLSMAERVSPADRLVLIELGGNDLIAGEPSDIFASALESVLMKLAAPGRTVVMFELPLLPSRVAYGQAQRRLAAKYGVWLIPKRCLASIIAGRGATSDGLHLTDAGSQRVALLVTKIVSPILKTNPITPTTPATHL